VRHPLTQQHLLVADGGDINCLDIRARSVEGGSDRPLMPCAVRPVVSADGGRMAVGGAGEITILDTLDGHALGSITTQAGDAFPIAWSPDGRWLEWATCQPGPGRCMTTVGSLDGSVHPDLPSPEDGGYWGGTAWSADGTSIIVPDGDTGSLVGRGDGADLRPFVHGGGQVWGLAPHGDQVAVGLSANAGGTNLAVVGLDGSDVRNITQFNDGTQVWDATWSPDGRTIAATTGVLTGIIPDHKFTGDVWLVGLDGSKRRVELPGHVGLNSAVRWSPDGTRLAVQMGTPSADQPTGQAAASDTVIASVDGSQSVVLRDATRPVWSADGSRLAVLATSGTQPTIDVVNADGTDRHSVAAAPSGDFGQFSWAP
jgi:Tol biopolymer transport system component